MKLQSSVVALLHFCLHSKYSYNSVPKTTSTYQVIMFNAFWTFTHLHFIQFLHKICISVVHAEISNLQPIFAFSIIQQYITQSSFFFIYTQTSKVLFIYSRERLSYSRGCNIVSILLMIDNFLVIHVVATSIQSSKLLLLARDKQFLFHLQAFKTSQSVSLILLSQTIKIESQYIYLGFQFITSSNPFVVIVISTSIHNLQKILKYSHVTPLRISQIESHFMFSIPIKWENQFKCSILLRI